MKLAVSFPFTKGFAKKYAAITAAGIIQENCPLWPTTGFWYF
jgi:hypothetical protein